MVCILIILPVFILCPLPEVVSEASVPCVASSQCSSITAKPQTPSFSAQRSAVLLWAAAQGCALVLGIEV